MVLAAAPTDTVRGEVDLYRADRQQPEVYFRLNGGQARSYTLEELAAAGDVTGLRYRKCIVPVGAINVPVLLQVLVAGPASLYFDPTSKLPATYYLDKPGVAPMPLKKPQFVQVLRTAFADCPTVNTQVAYMGNFVYSATDLRRYVVNYNRCINPRAPVQARPIDQEKEHVRLGMQAGLAQQHIYYPYTGNKSAMSGPITPALGLLVTLPLTNYIGFVTGITYSSFRSDNTFDSPYIGSTYTQTTNFKTRGALLRWPLTARITMRRYEALWRPYLQGGIQMSYLLGSQISRDIMFADPTVPLPASYFEESINGLGRGMYGEAGALFRFGLHQIGAGARFEQTNAFPVRGRNTLTDSYQYTFALTYYH